MLKHIFLILLLAGGYYLWDLRSIKHDPGILVEDEPVVVSLGRSQTIETENFTLQPRHQIQGEARVIARKRYWFDILAGLAPYDYVLAWDKMSDEAVLGPISVRIDDRSFDFRMASPPIPINEMRNNSLHTHFIASNSEIEELIKGIRVGHIIQFDGMIVDVKHMHGWEQTSAEISKNGNRRGSQFIWIEDLALRAN